jgi:NADH-quinone oxidoreductase subunit L
MIEEGRTVAFGPFTLPIASVITLITLFMLIGATGKSAQIPLFIWLPDAMAGPTPVSALIHAATMVTAGVYLMVRCNVLYANAELTSLIVTLIGAGTALVAGSIAIGQWDIKRVLAYSTISQLGFMVAAVGVGAYGAAMFHLVTHAFFKALLFLGSGSVIHGVEHGHHAISHEHGGGHGSHDAAQGHEEEEFDPQDMRNMGGLRERMPLTYWTYLVGTLALAGIFPFAGFWSKDEILADSWLAGIVEGRLGGFIGLALLLLAAGFTAFYMWRQLSLVFLGEPRTGAAEHAHESPPTMTVVLAVLAAFSVVAGFLNVPTGALGLDSVFGAHRFTFWLEQSVANAHAADFQWVIALGALALAVVAIFISDNTYRRQGLADGLRDPVYVNRGFRPIWRLANARLYWDETYNRLFEQPFNRISKFLADTVDWAFLHDYFHDTIIAKGFNAIGDLLSRPVDLGIIDGIVNGLGRLAQAIAASLGGVQTGYVRVYAISLLLGVVLVIILLLLPLVGRG